MRAKKAFSFRGVVAFLLVLVMLSSLFPTTVFAEPMDAADSGEQYEENVSRLSDSEDSEEDKDSGESADVDVSSGDEGEAGGNEPSNNVGKAGEDTSLNGADKTSGDAASTGTDKTDGDTSSSDADNVSDDTSEDVTSGDAAVSDYDVSVKRLWGKTTTMALRSSVSTYATGKVTTGNMYSHSSQKQYLFPSGVTSTTLKYFNGQPAYCTEATVSFSGGQDYGSGVLNNSRLKLALAYGYGGVNDSILLSLAGNADYAMLATQEVIWEITEGWDCSYLFVGPNGQYDASVAEPVQRAYEYIKGKMATQHTIPSFAITRPTQTYNDIELSFDGTNWTATVTDTNRVLPNFDRFTFSQSGITTSQSGYKLTITATPDVVGLLLNGLASNVSEGNTVDPDSISAWLLMPQASGQQECIALNGYPDPVRAYVRAKVTKTTGDLIIAKESEDGKVNDITFTVTGPDDYSETVTTNAQGKASILDLEPGTYTVTESTPDKYIPTQAQTVTLAIGEVKTVTFNNVLKKGTVKVTKTSEDGLVSGITFKLSGTSAADTTVNMTAVTDAQGIATFNDVPEGSNYSLEEVNTASKYVVPEVQTGITVVYNTVTDAFVRNVLKKWTVTVAKTDAETGNVPRGDGVFEGAVYGLYKDGMLVKEYTIGADGTFTTDEYICGSGYTIREITAPVGYQIDPNEYPIDTSADNYTLEHNNAPQITSVERINRGTFTITKFISDGTSGPAKFEGNAEFQYWLQAAGSYDAAKADERGTLTTNDMGYSGKSIALPYGTYVVHQTKTGDKGAALAPDFTVKVGEVDGNNQDLAVNNGPITAYLRVIKVDADDGEVIPWGGAEFEIYDADGNKIRQKVTYPIVTYIDKFVTNDEGYFVTPLVLPYGEHYRLVETKAPEGYELMTEALIFDVTPASIKLDAETGLVTVDVIAGDKAVPPEVRTTAADVDGNKELVISNTTTIVDKVYCQDVIPFKTYTVEGTLMVKSTGEPLRDADGNEITATNTFTAETDFTGYVELTFTFDSSALGGESIVVFETLKRNNKEVAVHADINDEDQTVKFKEPKLSTTATNALGGKVFLPLEQVTLVDTIVYEDMLVGQNYIAIGTLMDKATGEAVTDSNGAPIVAYKVFNPTESTGSLEVQFVFDASELSGKSLVVFERVYRGTEIVPTTPVFVSHEDIDDEGQTVVVGVPEIKTTATNNATGGKTIDPAAGVEVKDVVAYSGLIPGQKYTVTGKLMNKATGEAITDKDGKEITSSVTFTAEAANGSVDVIFSFDATSLRGATLVAFESLSYKDVEIAVHADINDVDQSVDVTSPTIKTSAKNAADDTKEFKAYTKVELIDTVSFTGLVAGNTYTVTGKLMNKATGKPVMGRNNKEITATTTFEAKSSEGTVDVSFVFDASLLGGKTLVVFESMTYNGTEIATHADINDVDQTVKIKRLPSYGGPEISTTATFDGKSKKNSEVSDNVTVVDTVNFTGLTVGKTYVLVGTLMDKETGTALKDKNGAMITSTTTFTPKSSNGAVNVTFKFDATKMDDKAIVVFETLYEGNVRDNKVIATHNDIMDGAQTVYFRDDVPTGDNGIGVWAIMGASSIVAACGLFVVMQRRKKKYPDAE